MNTITLHNVVDGSGLIKKGIPQSLLMNTNLRRNALWKLTHISKLICHSWKSSLSLGDIYVPLNPMFLALVSLIPKYLCNTGKTSGGYHDLLYYQQHSIPDPYLVMLTCLLCHFFSVFLDISLYDLYISNSSSGTTANECCIKLKHSN